jgi:hypothetical protein
MAPLTKRSTAVSLWIAKVLCGNLFADFNHDQKIDMVLENRGVFLGMNGCNYSTLVSIPDWQGNWGGDAIGMADLNGDGNPDIVAWDALLDGRYRRVPGRWTRRILLRPEISKLRRGLQYGNFLMGDLNNDTKLDIIVTRRDGWRVLLNTCP